MQSCRLIVEPAPTEGAWNMAVDEALLQQAVDQGVCTVRWYRWSQATLSLGYFQDARAAQAEPRLQGVPVVRRLTGGGAILHHHELTYSCTVPADHPLVRDPHEIYVAVHERIIEVLAAFGYAARLRGTKRLAGPQGEAFLCFGRGDECDVVMGPQKVLGSAQRRRRGAVLQHGSLVLRPSEFAPDFAGIFALAGHSVDAGELERKLAAAVGQVFAGRVEEGELDPSVREVAKRLHEQRYSRSEWNERSAVR